MPTAALNEFALIVEESAYGTPVTSPVVGTSAFYVPLVDGNSCSVVETPVYQEIPYGGGLDVVGDVVADHRQVAGQLNTLGYTALAAFLHQAAITRVNAGQTLPFVTAEPPNDLASFTLYHVIRDRAGVWHPYAYPGMKVESLEGTVSRQDPKLKLSLTLRGMKELPNAADSSAAPSSSLWPVPTEAQLPRGPYLFSHTAGNVLLGGSALTRYDALTYRVNNKLDPQWFEGRWIQVLALLGREATADCNLLLKATPDLRATHQALTSQGFALEFNNGANTLTVSFNGNNHVNALPFDLPLGKTFMQKATFRNKWDPAAGADVTVANT